MFAAAELDRGAVEPGSGDPPKPGRLYPPRVPESSWGWASIEPARGRVERRAEGTALFVGTCRVRALDDAVGWSVRRPRKRPIIAPEPAEVLVASLLGSSLGVTRSLREVWGSSFCQPRRIDAMRSDKVGVWLGDWLQLGVAIARPSEMPHTEANQRGTMIASLPSGNCRAALPALIPVTAAGNGWFVLLSHDYRLCRLSKSNQLRQLFR